MKFIRWGCAVVLGIACATMLLRWAGTDKTLTTKPVDTSSVLEQASDFKPNSTAPNELKKRSISQDDGSRNVQTTGGKLNASTSGLDARPNRDAPNGRVSAITPLELKFAEAAVGRPFPVSPVTARTCSDPRTAPYTRCEDVMSSLKRFSEEERDLTWARESEERLEASIENLQLGEYSILALECRTTRCAIEITTFQDPHWGETVRDGDFRRDLLPGAAVWTSVPDESGQRIYTTLRIFARHSTLKNGRLPE